jgi:hypothetical protein
VKNHLRVSHPSTVFVGFKLGELRHVYAIPPTEPNDFPKVIIGWKTAEIYEQIADLPAIRLDEGHAIKPFEKSSLIRVMIKQDIGGNDLKRVSHPFLLPVKSPHCNVRNGASADRPEISFVGDAPNQRRRAAICRS